MITMRNATPSDLMLLFKWANEESTRQQSYHTKLIELNAHVRWFEHRVDSDFCEIFIFENESGEPVGQVRFEIDDAYNDSRVTAVISISVGEDHRGKGYGVQLLKLATRHFLDQHKGIKIFAYIFKTNIPSYNSFIKAGYKLHSEECVQGIPSYILYAE